MVVDRCRDAVQVPCRDDDIGREATVHAGSDREPGGAQHRPPAAAPSARATAGEHGFESDQRTDPARVDVRSDGIDPAGHLVTHRHRRIEPVLVAHQVDVGATDAGGGHGHPNLPGAGLGDRDLDRERARRGRGPACGRRASVLARGPERTAPRCRRSTPSGMVCRADLGHGAVGEDRVVVRRQQAVGESREPVDSNTRL